MKVVKRGTGDTKLNELYKKVGINPYETFQHVLTPFGRHMEIRSPKMKGEIMRKPKIYVAGPYSTGDTLLNIRSAIDTAEYLKRKGAVPYLPHLTGFWHLVRPGLYRDWLDFDVEWLKVCDALFRMQGDSSGADKEVQFAEANGIPIFHDMSSVEDFIDNFKE